MTAIAEHCLDFIRPCNAITHSRAFHLSPRFIENFVGSFLYPIYVETPIPDQYIRYESILQEVGGRLAQNFPDKELNFEFAVSNDWNINVWCLPGGKITFTLGLMNALENEMRDFGGTLPTFEEKIAAILSHEMIHATARHRGLIMELRIFLAALVKTYNYTLTYFMKKLSSPSKKTLEKIDYLFDFVASLTVAGLGQCYSKLHELEADKYGMLLLHQKNIRPETFVWLQSFFIYQKLQSGDERLRASQNTLKELQSKVLESF
jgi:Zn-dependent protease with chaperone function